MMTESFFPDEAKEAAPEGAPHVDEKTPTWPDKPTATEDGNISEEGRLAAILSYIPFLCFVPLLNMRENAEARFHARQGVILFLLELVAVFFLIDDISDFVFKAVLIGAVLLSAAGIYFALQGKKFRLPIIGDLADKMKL
ncbi:MAG TPA: hypothetical protein VN285_05520 [Candidatus Deferrimicrobium sp.]|nr:hypothetical protein [Candidatus Deferrimicrobium sp.]